MLFNPPLKKGDIGGFVLDRFGKIPPTPLYKGGNIIYGQALNKSDELRNPKSECRNPKQIQNPKVQKRQTKKRLFEPALSIGSLVTILRTM
jgi:hypothetical protein